MKNVPEAGRIGILQYESRDLGYGKEKRRCLGYFTGETDTWGKHTFITLRTNRELYLFIDELKTWTTKFPARY